MIRLLLALSIAIVATASPIAPPDLTVACSGYLQNEPQCVTGTIVYFLDGIARTEMLRPTVLASEPAPLPPAILPPVETPVAPEVPVTSATPEPNYQDGLVAIVGLGILWGLIRGEVRTRGGK